MKNLLSATLIMMFMCQLVFSQQDINKNFYLTQPKTLPETITVGGPLADIAGFTSRAIQTAIDAMTESGGGTVKLLPGTFEIMAPVRLASNISLIGSGTETILHKVDGVQTKFILDADYGELKLTVEYPEGFRVGMGIQVYDKVQMEECWNVTTAVITAIEDNVLFIDNFLVRDYHKDDEGIVSNACPLVSGISVKNVRIADLTVDGNKSTNEFVNGCVGGGIYLHKVSNAVIENCLVRDWNGDGISWQITENVTVRYNEIYGCTNYGMHPGTGSPGSQIEGNNSHHNDSDGLYICWRVQNGLVTNNKLHHNGGYGICTGHKDSDMLYTGNHIYENGDAGVNLRAESATNAPHRSTFRNNIVENNSKYGFLIESPATDVVIDNNTIRDTDNGTQETGIYVSKSGLPVIMKNNQFSGHKKGNIVSEAGE